MQSINETTGKNGRRTNGIVYDFEVPGLAREKYEAINEVVFGDGLPEGLLHHAAWEQDGAFRIVEVWTSREAFEAYLQKTLGPVLAEHDAPEPKVSSASVVRRYHVAEG